MKKCGKGIYYILVILLFGLGSFVLLYKLGEVPYGIHVDEAGSMYDAMCILRYGVDRYLYHNPLYFINFGGGQNALYTYLAVFSFKVFGCSLWSFRLVAVIISLISYYLYYKLGERYRGKLFAIIILFLLVVLPVYVMKGRWGLESYLLNPLLIISLYFYMLAVDRNNKFLYILSGILFGISFYTYAISYLIIPIFIVLSIIYLIINRKIRVSNVVAFLVPVIILGMPLLLMLLINKGIIGEEVIGKFISIPKMWFYRGGEIDLANITNFWKNLKAIFIGNSLNYNSIISIGTVYMFSIPFIIFGLGITIFKVIKKKYDLLDIFMIFLFISIFGVIMCIKDLNVNKANAIYICFVYFIVVFFEWIYSNRLNILLVICLGIYAIYFIYFCSYYFKHYSSSGDSIFLFETEGLFEAINYAEEIRDDDGIIYMGIQQGYIYSLLANDIDPYIFNESVELFKNRELVGSFGHYLFYVFDYDLFYNNDYIYIYNRNSNRMSTYINKGFTMKEFGDYCLFYYDK